jgi:hypothetical protein
MCRDCRTEHGSGISFSVFFITTVLAVGVVLLWYAPLLGAIVIIGSVGAMGVIVIPAAIERIARWLSR